MRQVVAWLWVTKPFRGATSHSTAVVVSRERFGDDWPFTVPSGNLVCEDGGAVSFEVGTTHITRYALNNAARAEEVGQRRDPVRRRLSEEGDPIGPFWKEVELIRSVDADGAPATLGQIIKLGLTYCDPDFES